MLRFLQVIRSSFRILEAMRRTYPRLYFVEDDRLFKCLTTQSLTSGPLLSTVRILFPGVQKLYVDDKHGTSGVVKMIGGRDGDRFRLISGVPVPGPDRFLEEYLRDLGAALTTSVYEWTRHCLDSWDNSKVARTTGCTVDNTAKPGAQDPITTLDNY